MKNCSPPEADRSVISKIGEKVEESDKFHTPCPLPHALCSMPRRAGGSTM